MLRIQMVGLALVAVVTVCSLVVGGALAENWQWLLYHSQTGVYLLLNKEELVESEGLQSFTDSGGLANGATEHCHTFYLGTIGPRGLDLVKSITLEALGTKNSVLCLLTVAGGCKSGTMPTVEAIHLPWRTQLFELGTQVRDLILGNGSGAPGWKVTCTNLLGGTMEDTCIETAGKPDTLRMENDEIAGVLGAFNETESVPDECSVGGVEAGKVSGSIRTESPSSTLLVLISPLE